MTLQEDITHGQMVKNAHGIILIMECMSGQIMVNVTTSLKKAEHMKISVTMVRMVR